MVFQAERQMIESYVQSNFTSAEVKYDNIPYKESADKTFVALSILSETAEPVSVGANPISRHTGIINFDVYVPENTGTAEAREVATQIRSLFNNQILEGLEGKIYCSVPSLQRVTKGQGGVYRVSVIVPYQMFSGAS